MLSRLELKAMYRMATRFRLETGLAVGAVSLGLCCSFYSAHLAYSVYLRPIPAIDEAGLVRVTVSLKGHDLPWIEYRSFLAWKDRLAELGEFAGGVEWDEGWIRDGQEPSERLDGWQVTPDYFQVLGISPALGRSPGSAQDIAGEADTIVISEGLWKRHFGGSPEVLGQAMQLGFNRFTIVGVMPSEIRYLDPDAAFWASIGRSPDWPRIELIGRLHPEVTVSSAEAAIDALFQNSQQVESTRSARIRLVPLGSTLLWRAGSAEWKLLLFGGLSLLMLTMGALSAAYYVLLLANENRDSLATQVALGMPPRRLALNVLIHGFMLGLLATVPALAGGVLAIGLTPRLFPPWLVEALDLRLGTASLVALAGLVVATSVACSIPPAWLLRRWAYRSVQTQTAQRFTPVQHIPRLLLACQIATAGWVLVVTLAAWEKIHDVTSGSLGFREESVLQLDLAFQDKFFSSRSEGSWFAVNPQVDRVLETLIGEFEDLPGVRRAAAIQNFHCSDATIGLAFESSQITRIQSGVEFDIACLKSVTDGFFEVLEISPHRGRTFSHIEAATGPPVALVDQTLAALHWPSGNAIGRQIYPLTTELRDSDGYLPFEVIGVMPPIRDAFLADDALPTVYVPYQQLPKGAQMLLVRFAEVTLLLAITGNPQNAPVAEIRDVLGRSGKDLTLIRLDWLNTLLQEPLQELKTYLELFLFLSAVAIGTALLSAYSIASFVVSTSRKELALRQVLGASPAGIFLSVLTKYQTATLGGLAAASVIAYAGQRLLAGAVHGFSPSEFGPYAVGLGLLAAVFVLVWPAVLFRITRPSLDRLLKEM